MSLVHIIWQVIDNHAGRYPSLGSIIESGTSGVRKDRIPKRENIEHVRHWSYDHFFGLGKNELRYQQANLGPGNVEVRSGWSSRGTKSNGGWLGPLG
jgi:hypothetical protein